MSLKSFLNKCFIKSFLLTYNGYKSYKEYLKTKKYTKVQFANNFNGGPVLLLALYEKEKLREDIINLLQAAKNQGLYILAVNTLKILPENYRSDLIDVYIEKDNFGRDFGSYKCGMKYLYDNKISEDLSRLLILNDSLFYSKKNLEIFLNNLIKSNIDVLGATENYEISHHLGSFCISINNHIMNHPKLINYWKNYKNTNTRPLVIKNGEMALTNVLKSLTNMDCGFKAYYDSQFLEKNLLNNEDYFKNYYKFKRQGTNKKFWNYQTITESFEQNISIKTAIKKYLNLKAKKLKAQEIEDFFNSYDFSPSKENTILKRQIIGVYVSDFIQGSQIHNNCIQLVYLGLPIIKLDLLFRDVCSIQDILLIQSLLDPSEKDHFYRMLINKPSGSKNLRGINLINFSHGFI
ncbi:rhamnan synthesis F family protein [Acinetobacter sp. MD2(2019)]|uniref:rhamnan synthesis F family protein n=1 Tax=Acinetobacter sp. MD2(2019) TaxID=2605273 RepID=UPI002D1F6D93|nr:rhamnan synthesis F family protein [Acinetobacter sp. MD2(2019)]MEB3754429.1 hypothetical protein [Acinetobacter sp. MD2(2019)]